MNSTSVDREMRFALDTSSGVPFYRQVIQQIEHAVLAGKLSPGDRLPTIRSLAIELKINPNTIARAYGELEIRGLVLTQVGSGTFVSDKKPLLEDLVREKQIADQVGRFVRALSAMGVERAEMVDLVRDFKEA